MTPEVEQRFIATIHHFDHVLDVDGITGDCGFMMWFQDFARGLTEKPVFMSSLV